MVEKQHIYTDNKGVSWKVIYDAKAYCSDHAHSWEMTVEWDWVGEAGFETKEYFPCWTCRNCSAYKEPRTHHDWDLLYDEERYY